MTEIETLKAIEDIKQLKARYFRFTDTKDWQGLTTVFTEDAVLGDADTRFEGRDAVVDIIRTETAKVTTVHHGHGHEIWIDSPIAARGIVAFEDLGFGKRTGELMMHGYGHYHEDYRFEDGEWRIACSIIPRMAVLDRRPRG